MTSGKPGIAAQFEGKTDLAQGLAVFEFSLDREFIFKPGQYATLWLTHRDKTTPRPYSIASSPYQQERLEFYINLVQEGTLTPSLWDEEVLQGLRARSPETRAEITGPKGRFVLDPNDARDLIFVGSGTGLAPFVSMTRKLHQDWRASPETFPPRAIYLIHGAQNSNHLGYREELSRLSQETLKNPERRLGIVYLPTISRPQTDPSWTGLTGRAETLFENRWNGDSAQPELEAAVRELLFRLIRPQTHAVYVCGHPGTVENIVRILSRRGFKPDLDIKRERYYT